MQKVYFSFSTPIEGFLRTASDIAVDQTGQLMNLSITFNEDIDLNDVPVVGPSFTGSVAVNNDATCEEIYEACKNEAIRMWVTQCIPAFSAMLDSMQFCTFAHQ